MYIIFSSLAYPNLLGTEGFVVVVEINANVSYEFLIKIRAAETSQAHSNKSPIIFSMDDHSFMMSQIFNMALNIDKTVVISLYF